VCNADAPLRVALIRAEEYAITDAQLVTAVRLHDAVEDSSFIVADMTALVFPHCRTDSLAEYEAHPLSRLLELVSIASLPKSCTKMSRQKVLSTWCRGCAP